jgi:hexosaminidase
MKLLKFLFLFVSIQAFAQDNAYNLVPFPAQFSGQSGQFKLNAQTQIVLTAKDAALKSVATSLGSALKSVAKKALPIASKAAPTAKNVIHIRQNKTLRLGTEGYRLSINPDRVILEAETPQGAFYGLQTILQLLPAEVFSPTMIENVKWAMPACEIQDKPRYGYRGLMLDVGRNFMPVSFIKKYIDLFDRRPGLEN